jgi:hypothetical protein
MLSPTDASEVARRLLSAELPRRWAHVQAVGAKAQRVGHLMGGEEGNTLALSAWLHDIGYSPGLIDTGLHSLDGARWLSANGFDARIAALVAHHSCARLEAKERGLADQLKEFDCEETAVADALCFCDMTTGPDGETLATPERLREIRERYGPDDVVTRFITRAEQWILAAVERTYERLPALRAHQSV